MNKANLLTIVLVLLSTAALCHGDHDTEADTKSVAAEDSPTSLWEQETLTNNWFGLGEELSSQGLTVSLGITQIYQQNLQGGLSTHRHAGRNSGSYDLEFEFDLEQILNLSGGSIYMSAEGSWSDGLDASSIGSIFGVNADAAGDRSIDVHQLYYEQALFNDTLRIRVGKLDLTGGFEYRGCPVSFDGNRYANDESAQFLNGALVNNPTIPFPEQGLGIVLYLQPAEWWCISAGVADAQADVRETGFNTTFNGENYFFYVFEAGVTPQLPSNKGPLQGTYRVGIWYDPQPKERNDGAGTETDDAGFYISFDQVVCKENNNEKDTQGLAGFARYGWANDEVNEIEHFWSAGAQYQGLIPSRDDDVLAVGVARGQLVSAAGFTESHETAVEMYYNLHLAPWLSISPSVQYIFNPGGDSTVKDATVVGFRVQMGL